MKMEDIQKRWDVKNSGGEGHTLSKVLSWDLPGQTDKNYENSQSR
jgi:hypothetical protein